VGQNLGDKQISKSSKDTQPIFLDVVQQIILMPKTKVHVFDCSVHFIILIYYALLPLLQRSCINDINSQGTQCNTEPREKTRGSSKTKYAILDQYYFDYSFTPLGNVVDCILLFTFLIA
jgi:hypothetical protein